MITAAKKTSQFSAKNDKQRQYDYSVRVSD